MDELLCGLNAAQRNAVTSPASVLQVLAPPGSGKTKTLTARVAYLINNHGYRPWNIIVCTFTIKAAREMKERISKLVGEGIEKKLILGTFHSVARRFLAVYGQHIGIAKDFGIADSGDTLAILKRIIKRRSYGIEPGVARSRISGQKAKCVSAEQFASTCKSVEQHEYAALYSEYEETLKASNLLDYDDLLLRCVELLRKYPSCVSNVQAVLIDEFQDTNHVQYDLMGLFAQHRRTITIVGDPDQSIYGFRSAEIKNLGRMRAQYPDTVVVILEENYRSSGAILLSALEVIEQDVSRPAKTLLSTHCAGARPVLRRLPSALSEAKWIVMEIQRCRALTGRLLGHGDFSILLRSAALSRHIETELGKAGIPYRMVGGHRFFDRLEVKLILDYLRVINQPEHNDALIRIINVPSRKIGEVTVKHLLEEAEASKVSLWSIVLNAAQGKSRPKTNISSQAQKGLDAFVNVILSAQQKISRMNDESSTLIELITHVLKKLSFVDYLKRTHPEDHEARMSNVDELVAQAADMSIALAEGEDPNDESLPLIDGAEQRETTSAGDVLAKFLANVALSTEVEKTEGSAVEQVTISTIHAAKGLEWPVVFIPAAYEGSIPHSRAEDTDEERRLLYVGMTRAKALLYVSCPVKNSQREETSISPFLKSARLFDDQAPSIRHGVTLDLARILGRDCPSEATMLECRGLVERIEDDLWPLDGSEIEPENKYWDRRNGDHDRFNVQQPFKRRRMDPTVPVETAGVTVTMQQQECFSIASSSTVRSGFVSAGSHFQALREQEQQEQHLSRRRQEASSARPALKKQPSGQGSITSFFKSKTTSSTTLATTALATSNINRNHRLRTVDPLSDTSNTKGVSSSSTPAYKISFSTTSNSTPIAPQSRKPRTAPMLQRPPARRDSLPTTETEGEATVESRRYILLSSSPTKDVGAEIAPAPTSPVRQASNASAINGHQTSRFKPVSTFHTTSLAQLTSGGRGAAQQHQHQQQRKTLGMRRSLQGWSASRPKQT